MKSTVLCDIRIQRFPHDYQVKNQERNHWLVECFFRIVSLKWNPGLWKLTNWFWIGKVTYLLCLTSDLWPLTCVAEEDRLSDLNNTLQTLEYKLVGISFSTTTTVYNMNVRQVLTQNKVLDHLVGQVPVPRKLFGNYSTLLITFRLQRYVWT